MIERGFFLFLALFVVPFRPALAATDSEPRQTTLQQQRQGQQLGKNSTDKSQEAIVETDGAAMYERPDFDSPVLDYLGRGTKLRSARKLSKGIGGFGLFFRVKTPAGVFGYVADTDLIPEFSSKATAQKKTAKNPEFAQVKDEQESAGREPLYFTRFIGAQVGYLGFSEKFSGKVYQSNSLLVGFKMTGPGTLFDGPPLDFHLSVAPTAPEYYERFARKPASGYFVFSDTLFVLPFLETDKFLLSYGLGFMLTYTRFRVLVSQTEFDSEEVRVGGVAGVSGTYRIGKIAGKWDTRYYYEKTSYFGHWLSLLFEYR